MHPLADAGYHRRPPADKQQGKQHLRRDAPVKPQKDGPFRMVIQVARSNLLLSAQTTTFHNGAMPFHLRLTK